MTHPFETGPLPQGWVAVGDEERADLTKRLLYEQPRMALLTQLKMEVIARHETFDSLLVRTDPQGGAFYVTRLTGKRLIYSDCPARSVATPKDLEEGLQAAG